MLSKHEFERRYGAKFDPAQGLVSWKEFGTMEIEGLEDYTIVCPWIMVDESNEYERASEHIREIIDDWYNTNRVFGGVCAKITRRSRLLCCMTSGPN